MQNKHVDMSEQTPQTNIYSTTKLNSSKLGLTISEEIPFII